MECKLFDDYIQIRAKQNINMTSVIKHINLEQFPQIIGREDFDKIITQNKIACVFFITDWSVPSRSLMKRLKRFQTDTTQQIGIVDVDLVDNIQLCEQFQIKSVPTCLLFKEGCVQEEFKGMNVNKMHEFLHLIEAAYPISESDILKNKIHVCPKNHELLFVEKLEQPLYVDNYFYCNKCKRIDVCSSQKLVGHCEQCDYDLCTRCWRGAQNIKSKQETNQ